MKKRRRPRKLIFGSVILILGMSMFKATDDYRSILMQKWHIPLSAQSVELFEKSNPASSESQGIQFHVFQYQSADNLKASFTWSYKKNTLLEKSVIGILQSLNTPSRYYPNFDQPYGYIIKTKPNGSKMYMIYFKNSNIVYFIESSL